MRVILTIISVILIFLFFGVGADKPTEEEALIPFPEGYASEFTNYLSMDRTQHSDQILRLFGNDLAMEGPGEDGKLPYGSILVAEVFKAKKDSAGNVIVSELGRRIRDKFAVIAVMQRGEGWGEDYPDSLSNDNWEFATFKPNGGIADKDLNECRACHAPLKKTNHLFSLEHIEK
ncbi:MAG: cytochrome P460 family protein [Calditrichia bacterium]